MKQKVKYFKLAVKLDNLFFFNFTTNTVTSVVMKSRTHYPVLFWQHERVRAKLYKFAY